MSEAERTREDRIREVAHRIWREEGCPHGRGAQHWHMATGLVAMEEGYASDRGEAAPKRPRATKKGA